MSLSPTLIWNTVAIALGVIAGVLFLWAMFWDRARGRLRCPKCWYDMRGTVEASAEPPWRCPECGTLTKSSARLRRTRRRKWIAAFAGAQIAVASYAPIARDRVIARGWVGTIPTTLLVLIAPVDLHSWRLYTDESFDGTTTTVVSGLRRDSSPLFLQELVARFDEYDAWLLHWRLFYRRIIADVPEIKAVLCESRDAWPRGESVFVMGRVPHVIGNREYDLRIRASRRGAATSHIEHDEFDSARYEGSLGPIDSAIEVEIEIQLATRQLWITEEGERYQAGPDPKSYRTVWRGIARTIAVEERRASEIMHPVDDPSDGMEIRKELRPVLLLHKNGEVDLGLDHMGWHYGGPNDCALGLRVEVLRDGLVVATGEHFIRNYRPTKGAGFVQYGDLWVECTLRWAGNEPTSQADLNAAAWTLRAIGDPVVSLRDFNRDRYWPGSIEMPLKRLEEAENEEAWNDDE